MLVNFLGIESPIFLNDLISLLVVVLSKTILYFFPISDFSNLFSFFYFLNFFPFLVSQLGQYYFVMMS